MATNIYFTTEELDQLAQRYLPRQVMDAFTRLRVETSQTVDNPIRELRRSHEPYVSIVQNTFSGIRQLKNSGLDPAVVNAAVKLLVNEAVEVTHLWHERITELGQLAFAKLQEERAAENQEDESIYQAYAQRRWLQFERSLNAGRSLPEILMTITDRKDCRVLRESYPAWYQSKYGLTGYDEAISQLNKLVDQNEMRFMSDREKKLVATWQEVEIGLSRMETAFSQVLVELANVRSYPPRLTPIPLWMPSEDGENVVWVE